MGLLGSFALLPITYGSSSGCCGGTPLLRSKVMISARSLVPILFKFARSGASKSMTRALDTPSGIRPAQLLSLESTISGLATDPSDVTFVDFGSGKRRVVLIAAFFPLKAIIGVELSRELHEIALETLRRASSHLKNIQRISSTYWTSSCHSPTRCVIYYSIRTGGTRTPRRAPVVAQLPTWISHFDHLCGSSTPERV